MRGLFTFISVLGLLALIGSGLYYAYGFGLQSLNGMLQEASESIAEEIEEENSIEGVEVSFSHFYLTQNFQFVVIQIDLAHDSLPDGEIRFATLSIPAFQFNEVSAINPASFKELTPYLAMDPVEVQSSAIAYAAISAAVWIGFWVLKVFLKPVEEE
ncbi:hypothetical protein JV173_02695 [Acholeplasma equirhinis]|uniref:hypothetical protein n=1 Tax=Acholeplasma equirhinis TaxID=555393 RepID=UPI00197AAF93|nr:hypothetical protein [Acholeplasma equirhinis]MBN3490417.1 hypothetical protein [Acholeplasma equirhinis]